MFISRLRALSPSTRNPQGHRVPRIVALVVKASGRAFSQVNNRKTLTDRTLLGVLGPRGPNPAEELIAQLKNTY